MRSARQNRSSRPHRGGTMVLVMLAVAIAFVIGLTFLRASTSVTAIADTMDHHAQARQIAESGLAITMRYVESTPNWRDTRTSGRWVSDLSLLGGAVSVDAAFDASPAEVVALNDSSFEQQISELANPPISPPMSGVVGGWQVQRTAALETGATVPHIGVTNTPGTTLGANHAFISCSPVVVGSGRFSQTLTTTLQPNRRYELAIDISRSGLALFDSRFGFRLLAGGAVIASTEHAWTSDLQGPPNQPPNPPQEPPTSPEVESLVEVLALSGGFSEYTLSFTTNDEPPSGPLQVELTAESAGLSAIEVAFDNVRLTMAPHTPLVLTATGRHGAASHVVEASVLASDASSLKIVQWSDP